MRAKFHRIESGFGFALVENLNISYSWVDFGSAFHTPPVLAECMLPYICLVGMCRPKGYGFLRRFGLKAGIDFTYFGLNSGTVFEGMHERICHFNSE